MLTKLVILNTENNDSFEVELTEAETRIGRAANRNEVVLDDGQVSREHAVIRRIGSRHLLVDTSVNGTYLNGDRVTEHMLNFGDTFTISKYNITYSEHIKTLNVKFDNQKIGNTVLLRKPEEVVTSLPAIDKTSISMVDFSSKSIFEDVEALRRKAETLSRIYELNEMLGSVFKLEDIFAKVSEMIFRLTPADRFLVLLRNAETGELEPFMADFRRRVKTQAGSINSSTAAREISVSRTVLDRVISERISLLSLDTQADERLASAKSIIMQNIHSVMCAPLLGKDGVLGAIYVDCQQLIQTFTEEDLDFLNAVAGGTSIAVDNAMTHNRLVKEELARAKYGRFMPKFVVDQILANPHELMLGGTNAVVTVLFSDIRGFTTMSESLPPETVVQILNEYFSDMAPIVFAHKGLLDKYMGDGMMALFGVPYANEESAVNAVSAAIAMQRRMEAVNQALRAIGLSEISIGIGINTGMATVGYIGSEERTDYTAIGDSVNLGARLEKEAQAGQIIISQATRQAIGDRFAVRPAEKGEVKVKGKRVPVQIYEVLWGSASAETQP